MTRSPSEDHALARPFRRPHGWPTSGPAAAPPAFADARAALDERVEALPRRAARPARTPGGLLPRLLLPRPRRPAGLQPARRPSPRLPDRRPRRQRRALRLGVGLVGQRRPVRRGAAVGPAPRRSAMSPGRADADAALLRPILLGYAARYRTMPPAPRAYPGVVRRHACAGARSTSRSGSSAWPGRRPSPATHSRPAELADLARWPLRPGLEHLHRVRYRQIQNVGNWDRGAILTLGPAPRRRGHRDDGPRRGVRRPRPAGARRHGRRTLVGALPLLPLLRAGRRRRGRCARCARPAVHSTARTSSDGCSRRRWTSRFPMPPCRRRTTAGITSGSRGRSGTASRTPTVSTRWPSGGSATRCSPGSSGENRSTRRPRATMEALLDGATDLPDVKRGRDPFAPLRRQRPRDAPCRVGADGSHRGAC